MAGSMEPCKMLWGRPLLSWQRNLHKIAYKSACMADRPEMLGPTRGFSEMADSTMQNVVGPYCHGNEIWAKRGDLVPTGLLTCFCVHAVAAAAKTD